MAARRRRRRKRSALDYIRFPSLDLDPDTKKGVFIVLILALGSISLLGLFDLAGVVGQYLRTGLIEVFGWGRWVFPFILLFWGYALYDEERFEIRLGNYLGMILFLLSFHALLFLFVEYDRWPEALAEGAGGGYVGLVLASTFIKLLGFLASLLLTISLVIISFLLAFNTSLGNIFSRSSIVGKLFYPINFILARLFRSKNEEEEEEEDEEDEEEDEEEDNDDEEEEDDDKEEDEEEDEEEGEDDEEAEDEEEDEEKTVTTPQFTSKEVRTDDDDVWWMDPTGIKIDLPLSLLSAKREKPTSGDIKNNKEVIKKSLENFGILVEMGDVSIGPTVTRYTFRPAEGIKLSRITNLSNDLALALASHPIRIEAPIPRTHLVGVEVPNQSKATVTLREVLTAKNFKERKSSMMMALGKDVAGQTWIGDLTKMPHLLVAGATNSGKSVCLNSIIVSLIYQNNPDELRFIMVDPKRVELTAYDDIPYLLTPVITDVHKTINALKWCLNEMERRYDILKNAGQKNISGYNENNSIKMPYIVFVIDELADLMVAAAKEIEGGVIRLAQMARAIGIHLVLATQRPSVDVITGLIKANMPGRIAFSVASNTDSRTILDTMGAEKLLGRGDMLYQNAEISKPVRLQGALVSELETKKIVRYIKQKASGFDFVENITERQMVKGIGGVGLDGMRGDEDELLLEAKKLIVNTNKASASYLQRRLRIGYARAASILDQLEDSGVIGPVNGAKPREILMTRQQIAAMDSQGISGVPIHNREESEAPENFLGEESGSPPVFSDDEDTISGLKQDEDEDISSDDEVSKDEDDNEEAEEDIGDDGEEENEEEEISNDENEDEDAEENEEDDEEEDEGRYFSK